jgi:hypothetical protein
LGRWEGKGVGGKGKRRGKGEKSVGEEWGRRKSASDFL